MNQIDLQEHKDNILISFNSRFTSEVKVADSLEFLPFEIAESLVLQEKAYSKYLRNMKDSG